MPVELRKRPPPKETATPAPTAKRGSGSTVKKLADKAKEAILPTKAGKKNGVTADAAPAVESETKATNGTSSGASKIAVGETVNLEGFGGTVQTHDGKDVTLKALVDKSGAGVVIFTYPRASTPGCKFCPSQSFYLVLDGLCQRT